jgi:hypothetical protein
VQDECAGLPTAFTDIDAQGHELKGPIEDAI